jgi:uncharacterized membrane protein required for colicin V production
MALDKLPFNWFDFAIVIVLLVGILRGRKHGMSEELLPLIQWLVIVFAAAFFYDRLGRVLAQNAAFSLLFSYVVAYLIIAMVTKTVFTVFRRLLKGKLVGANIFGGGEYYLGMLSGMTRFACMLMAVLALLNARLFTLTEVKAMETFQKDMYGSEFFPTLHTLQQQVFEKSLSGPWIKANLNLLLIRPTAPEKKELRRKELDIP